MTIPSLIWRRKLASRRRAESSCPLNRRLATLTAGTGEMERMGMGNDPLRREAGVGSAERETLITIEVLNLEDVGYGFSG